MVREKDRSRCTYMINALLNVFMLCLACNDTPFFWFHVGIKTVQDKLDHFQKTGFKYVDHEDCLFFCMGFAANRQYTLINTASTRLPPASPKGVCLVTHNTVQRERRRVNPNFLHLKHKVSQMLTRLKFSLINKRKF